MKRFLLAVILAVLVSGCRRGDFKMSTIIAGQPATHAGYNIGPELYLEPGDIAVTTGVVLWLEVLDPNDLWLYKDEVDPPD